MRETTIRVVIADDNTFFSETLYNSLNKTYGIHISNVINDYNTLVAYCKSASFDILILDVNFNGINTLENINSIRHSIDDFKIIILTTLENNYTKTLAHNANINAFISKNSSFKNFETIIKQCYENHFFFKIAIKEKAPIIINDIVFTERKIEILKTLYEFSYENEKQIAKRLNISFDTLKSHKKELFEMTHTNRLVDLIKFGLKNGILLQ